MDEPTFRLKEHDYKFSPFGGPLDQEEVPQVVTDIGQALLAFARLEHMVAALAIHINKKKASVKLYDPNPSKRFGSLLKLVQKWISKHPDLKHLSSPDDNTIFKGLLEGYKLRNLLAHGFLSSVDEEAEKFEMHSVTRVGKDTWRLTAEMFSFNEPRLLAKRADLATRHFAEVANVVFEKEDGDARGQTP